MIVPRLPATKISPYFIKIDDFKGATNTLINESRLDTKFATESVNLYQTQDGIWKTRPGVRNYGQEIPEGDHIDGATEYEKDNGDGTFTRQVVAIANGKAWVSEDGGSWTEITGATFTTGVMPFFLQIRQRLYIATGVDPWAYYDGTQLNDYTAIDTPVNLAATRSNLTSGSFDNFYRVVAVNEVGFTEPSASDNETTNKARNLWSGDDKIDLAWDAVAGATGYQIFWGRIDGEEYYIGDSTTNAFTDDGSVPENQLIETPDDNTTGAPRFRSMEVSGARIWATYDPEHPFRVYFSGTGRDLGSFSPFYGGGYVDLEKGGRNKPVSVVHYRTGKGDPVISVLCSSPDGNGSIFQVEMVTLSVGDVAFTVPAVYKLVGSIGADSPYAVVKGGDNIYFLNKKGCFTLRSRQQIFNVISTDDLSSPIRNKFEALNQAQVSTFAGYFRPPRVFFTVSEGANNDTTLIFDLERNNWTYKWTIGFKQFFEYTENSQAKTTRFMGVMPNGKRLVEISENYLGDFGEPFYQSYISPLIPINKDYTDLAKVRDVVYEIGKFRGTVRIEVLGITRDKQISTLAAKTIPSTTGITGWSDDLFSDFLFSDTNDVPSVFAESSTKRKIRVGKKLYAIQFKISSTSSDTSFELLGIQAKGTRLQGRAPSSWN